MLRLCVTLRASTSLASLDLCHNKIGDVGGVAIGKALEVNTSKKFYASSDVAVVASLYKTFFDAVAPEQHLAEQHLSEV